MPKEVIAIDPQLSINLRVAKNRLKEAQAVVDEAQDALYIAAGKVPEKGTIHVTGCKITTAFNDTWDQDMLREIEKDWSRHSNLPFPFKTELKADGKAITYIRENAKAVWDILSKAVTSKPKKPSFELED